MRLIVTIDEGVYNFGDRDQFVGAVEREINCLLDDAYSPAIKVREVATHVFDSDLDEMVKND
jgi:hypothetical protein